MTGDRQYRLCGLALLAGAVVFVLSTFLAGDGTGVEQYLSTVSMVGRCGQILGGALLLAGLPGLYAYQSARAGRLGLVAFAMAFLGIAIHWNVMSILAFAYHALASNGATRGVISDGILEQGTVFMSFFAVGVLTAYLGIVLLGVATFRARVFPRPAGVLLMVGPIITIMVLPAGLGSLVTGLASAIMVSGFAWCGLTLSTQPGGTEAPARRGARHPLPSA